MARPDGIDTIRGLFLNRRGAIALWHTKVHTKQVIMLPQGPYLETEECAMKNVALTCGITHEVVPMELMFYESRVKRFRHHAFAWGYALCDTVSDHDRIVDPIHWVESMEHLHRVLPLAHPSERRVIRRAVQLLRNRNRLGWAATQRSVSDRAQES